jgi:hypothetical protein
LGPYVGEGARSSLLGFFTFRDAASRRTPEALFLGQIGGSGTPRSESRGLGFSGGAEPALFGFLSPDRFGESHLRAAACFRQLGLLTGTQRRLVGSDPG